MGVLVEDPNVFLSLEKQLIFTAFEPNQSFIRAKEQLTEIVFTEEHKKHY